MCEYKYRWTIRKIPEIWGNRSPAKIGDSGIKTRTCEEMFDLAVQSGVKNTAELLARWNNRSDVWFYEGLSAEIDFSGGFCRNCRFRASSQANDRLTAFSSAHRRFQSKLWTSSE